MHYIFKDLRGKWSLVSHKSFTIVEELRIYISSIYPHINPYTIRVCVKGVFLSQFDKIPMNEVIYIWQSKDNSTNYKVSDVFDAISQINGVFYTTDESSDSEDSFHSAPDLYN